MDNNEVKSKSKVRKFAHRVRTSPNHHTKTAKNLKRGLLFASGIVVLLIAASVYLLIHSRAPVVHTSPQQQVAEALTGTNASDHTVQSTLGFTLHYQGSAFDVEGQVTDLSSSGNNVTGQSYTSDELAASRPYSIVKFQVPATKNGQFSYDNPELTVLTNIRKDYWTSRISLAANKNKSKLDIIVSQTSATEAESGYNPVQTADLTVNNVAYRQVTYEKVDQTFGVKSVTQDIYYFTVQNDRPYFISISNVTNTNNSLVAEFQTIIKTISFPAPTDPSLAVLPTTSTLALARAVAIAKPLTDSLPAGTSNVPTALDTATIIKVVAVNQPAVVRVGLSGCAKLELLLPDGTVGATLNNACSAGVGSGSFVSSDGYIATNGHVTRVTPQEYVSGYVNLADDQTTAISNLKLLFKYFIDAGISTSDQEAQLIEGVQSGDTTATNLLSSLGSLVPSDQIKVVSEDYKYAIQTSNEPISYDLKTNSFKYTSTVIPATYVDSNVDLKLLEDGGLGGPQTTISTNSDVSILKAKGSFPVVRLGSIGDLAAGSELTAIGFPAFVDGGLLSTKPKTYPSITQGTIEQLGPQSDVNAHILLSTTVPIAAGNSGGPSFDTNGNEIGLNTYGSSNCADSHCFGNGIIRDIADYKDLLQKNNISLNTQSKISDAWDKGLVALQSADYPTALSNLKKAQSLYPANYLAESFIAIAQAQVDIQTAAQNKTILTVVLIVIGVLILVGLILLVILLVHLSRHKPQPPVIQAPPSPLVG